ncbi:MAG TPA: phosphoribosylanthranilate isomerase [Balneolaceae bacterium]|nr:phosphoribosylanthranilate isomerase [Balneolaceae bacterium]
MPANRIKPKVKICGLTSLHDARFVAGARADYMGFIFYNESPRYIEPGQAGAIINWVEGPECVGVFVNQPLDDVNLIARQTGVDMVQLHGDEPKAYCSLVEKPVIKAIHISDDMSAESLEEEIDAYRSEVDYLLFDTKVEGKWGGTGQSFDWTTLQKLSGEISFFLSGGLNAGNIRAACETVHPHAVDVSSGVESEPGKKSFDKIENFMEQIREL